MKTLIVGIGALGGIIGGRLRAAGSAVWLATRTAESAAQLKASGLSVTGVGGALSIAAPDVAPIHHYSETDAFDLIVLATKARAAIDNALDLARLLALGGTLLPIQNGGVSQILGQQLGNERVLGGLSNLGGTMTTLGHYEQRNAGHLLIGELGGGHSDRAERVRTWLGRAVEVRVTPNLSGAVWSKLILNCSTTTIGALAGATMREYIASAEGRELFSRTYDEALSVALASGVHPQRMLVEPVPPGWSGRSVPGAPYDAWLAEVLAAYGDLKASMLQDIERRRPTEIDFINGYVVDLGRQLGVSTPANAAIVETIRAISRGETAPGPTHLGRILEASR
ncbi:MAG: 2-dehydropantoate 2-reductase [Pseudomonadota bacterium]